MSTIENASSGFLGLDNLKSNNPVMMFVAEKALHPLLAYVSVSKNGLVTVGQTVKLPKQSTVVIVTKVGASSPTSKVIRVDCEIVQVRELV